MIRSAIKFLALFLLLSVTAFGAQAAPRWYSMDQVAQGEKLFQANCAGCHGDQAQGQVVDWRRPLPDGSMPAPPLDGSAHAWHHPLKDLLWVIREGTMQRGGKMPPFKGWLAGEDQQAIVAFFQQKWDDGIYRAWLNRRGLEK